MICLGAFTCVKKPDSLLFNMLITAPQRLMDREESSKMERPSFYRCRSLSNTIYASMCASLMSRSEPHFHQHGGVCNRNLWLSFVPNNRVRKLPQREQKRSRFMIYVLMLWRHIGFYHSPMVPWGHLTLFHMHRPCFSTLLPANKNVVMRERRWVSALAKAFQW